MKVNQVNSELVLRNEPPVEWQLEVPRSLPETIKSSVSTNHNLFTPGERNSSLIIVRGYGEQEEWVAVKVLTALTILKIPGIVIGVGIDQSPSPETVSLESYAHQAVGKIINELQERELTSESTNAIGHSMGGALLGLALKEYPDLIGSVGFEEPVAHDTAARKLDLPDDIERRKKFGKEFGHVLIGPYKNIKISESLKAAKDISSQLYRDIFPQSDHRLRNSFTTAVTLDAAPYVLEHAANNNVAYVIGKNDPLINLQRLERSLMFHAGYDNRLLEAYKSIQFSATDQKHSFMGWQDGINHLEIVTGLLKLHN